MRGEEASGGRNQEVVCFGDQGKDDIINNRHIMGCAMFFETGVIFM
jgi:hypothetical protein